MVNDNTSQALGTLLTWLGPSLVRQDDLARLGKRLDGLTNLLAQVEAAASPPPALAPAPARRRRPSRPRSS